jgi:DNA-binding MarR family transcriptional regulator
LGSSVGLRCCARGPVAVRRGRYASKYYAGVDEVRAWLSRLSRLNNSVLETRAVARASTNSEDAVLGALLVAGPVLNPSVLKTLVIQSPGGLTKTLRRLEDAGFIRRVTDPADRRALLVELTPKGRRAAVRTVQAVDTYYDELLADLDDWELEQLGLLLRKVLDRLETLTKLPSEVRIASSLGRGKASAASRRAGGSESS